jgi:hypothetical protein
VNGQVAGVIRVSVPFRHRSRIGDANRAFLVAVGDDSVIGFVDAALQKNEDDASSHLPGMDGHVEEPIVTQALAGAGHDYLSVVRSLHHEANRRLCPSVARAESYVPVLDGGAPGFFPRIVMPHQIW